MLMEMEKAIKGHMRGAVRYRSTKDQNPTSGMVLFMHRLDCHVCDRSYSMACGMQEMESR